MDHFDDRRVSEGSGMETTIGSSLPVPNVQALAAALDDASEIPESYLIRPEFVEADPVASDDDPEFKLPVIDLQRAKLFKEEALMIGDACQEWGFFQLINHGVPGELMEKMMVDISEFFKLPLEEKNAYAQLPNDLEGYGQIFVKSRDQKLEWGDMISLTTRPHAYRLTRFWPTNPSTFRDTLDTYTEAVEEVVTCLLRLTSENLGLQEDFMMNNFKGILQNVRISYYPKCTKADKVIGLSPHSDNGIFTILLQSSDVQGLQIRKNGATKWFPVKPLQDALVVNVGDMLEVLSNGKYKSIEHRVVINTEKERLSIATFHAPPLDYTVGPLPGLVKGDVEKYRTFTVKDYMKAYFSAKLDGKSRVESVKLRNN